MKKILVTGGGGYVGTLLVESLLKKEYKVTVVDTFWFGNYLKKNDNLKIIKSVLKELTKRNLNNEYLRVDKIRRFIGLTQSSASKGYHVARRYTLMPKRKNIKNKPDTLIDVELFTLDLKLKYYDIKI